MCRARFGAMDASLMARQGDMFLQAVRSGWTRVACYCYQPLLPLEKTAIAELLIRFMHNRRNCEVGLCFLHLWIKPSQRIVREKFAPLEINQCWAMDSMHDQLSNGRSCRLIKQIGEFNRDAVSTIG